MMPLAVCRFSSAKTLPSKFGAPAAKTTTSTGPRLIIVFSSFRVSHTYGLLTRLAPGQIVENYISGNVTLPIPASWEFWGKNRQHLSRCLAACGRRRLGGGLVGDAHPRRLVEQGRKPGGDCRSGAVHHFVMNLAQ